MKSICIALIIVSVVGLLGCGKPATPGAIASTAISLTPSPPTFTPTRRPTRSTVGLDPGLRIAYAAEDQVGVTTIYDPSYVALAYPNGDVPIERGVCTDVVVRAFRAIGIDLQVRVYEDMKRNFSVYPKDWGATAPTADTIPGTNRHYIIHNMGSGTHKEDALRYFTILGQYRW